MKKSVKKDLIKAFKLNEQIEEQTTSGDAGQYVQPQVWGKTSKDLKSVQDPNWPKYGGPKGEYVRVKKKCLTFPYCSQGSVDNPLEFYGSTKKKKKKKKRKNKKRKTTPLGRRKRKIAKDLVRTQKIKTPRGKHYNIGRRINENSGYLYYNNELTHEEVQKAILENKMKNKITKRYNPYTSYRTQGRALEESIRWSLDKYLFEDCESCSAGTDPNTETPGEPGFYCGDDPDNWTQWSPNGCVPYFYLGDNINDCQDGSDNLPSSQDPNTGYGVNDCNVYGCTDPTADNYNAEATADDGSCTFTILGCTDETACNYSSEANTDDGSCDYESCVGCADQNACNYSPSYTVVDNTQCTYPGCTDPTANNYVENAGCPPAPGSPQECDFTVWGCTDNTACNFNPAATADDESCQFPAAGENCAGEVLGCMDETALNFNPAADIDDPNNPCIAGTLGCMDDTAENYNELVTYDDGSCIYPDPNPCVGDDGDWFLLMDELGVNKTEFCAECGPGGANIGTGLCNCCPCYKINAYTMATYELPEAEFCAACDTGEIVDQKCTCCEAEEPFIEPLSCEQFLQDTVLSSQVCTDCEINPNIEEDNPGAAQYCNCCEQTPEPFGCENGEGLVAFVYTLGPDADVETFCNKCNNPNVAAQYPEQCDCCQFIPDEEIEFGCEDLTAWVIENIDSNGNVDKFCDVTCESPEAIQYQEQCECCPKEECCQKFNVELGEWEEDCECGIPELNCFTKQFEIDLNKSYDISGCVGPCTAWNKIDLKLMEATTEREICGWKQLQQFVEQAFPDCGPYPCSNEEVDPDVQGCTDPTAGNYNPAATLDDGTCEPGEPVDPCIQVLAQNQIDQSNIQQWCTQCQEGTLPGQICQCVNPYCGQGFGCDLSSPEFKDYLVEAGEAAGQVGGVEAMYDWYCGKCVNTPGFDSKCDCCETYDFSGTGDDPSTTENPCDNFYEIYQQVGPEGLTPQEEVGGDINFFCQFCTSDGQFADYFMNELPGNEEAGVGCACCQGLDIPESPELPEPLAGCDWMAAQTPFDQQNICEFGCIDGELNAGGEDVCNCGYCDGSQQDEPDTQCPPQCTQNALNSAAFQAGFSVTNFCKECDTNPMFENQMCVCCTPGCGLNESVKRSNKKSLREQSKTPQGLKIYQKAHAASGKSNTEGLELAKKKIANFMKDSGEALPSPPMHRNNKAQDEYVEDVNYSSGQTGLRFTHPISDKTKDRHEKYLKGSSETGNAVKGKEIERVGPGGGVSNVMTKNSEGGANTTGEMLSKAAKRRAEKEALGMRMANNNRRYTPDTVVTTDKPLVTVKEHVIDTPKQILNLTPPKYKKNNFVFEITNGDEIKKVRYESFKGKKGGHIIILDSKNPNKLNEQLGRMKNLMNHNTNTRHDKFR
tara:strand:- start:2515 stop:6699 length:4185 start_codon:yes stop_codon:yes gene_type:complete